MTNLIDGKKIAEEIREEIKNAVIDIKDKIVPALAVILVGNNPASISYVKAKEKALLDVDMKSYQYTKPETISQQELIDFIKSLNANPYIHGILVQLPLPKHLNEREILNTISPEKDVDGFTPVNIGNSLINEPSFIPCTPLGIVEMLDRSNINLNGSHVVVIGRSNIVGRPLANLLSSREYGNATVTLCHTGTKNLKDITLTADVIVVATGVPKTLTGDMIKEGTIVIDVGVNRILSSETKSGYKLIGDCEFETCQPKAKLITPVPGGVGPMTIAMLLSNTYQAAINSLDHTYNNLKTNQILINKFNRYDCVQVQTINESAKTADVFPIDYLTTTFSLARNACKKTLTLDEISEKYRIYSN